MIGFLIVLAIGAGIFFFVRSKINAAQQRSSRRSNVSDEGRKPDQTFEGWLSPDIELLKDRSARQGVKFALGVFEKDSYIRLSVAQKDGDVTCKLPLGSITSIAKVQSTPDAEHYLWFDLVKLEIDSAEWPFKWDLIYLAPFDEFATKRLYEALEPLLRAE